MAFRVFLGFLFLFSLRAGASGYDPDYDYVSIGILKPQKPRVVQILVENGDYMVRAGGDLILNVDSGERVMFSFSQSLVQVSRDGAVIGRYKDVKLRAKGNHNYFRLFVLSGERDERVYDDDLHLLPDRHVLKLINRVFIEKYVAGVVEAETGKEKSLEFYKAQAIISRTYALNNLRKHWREGFNLNDQVDCQVYHGKARWEPLILEAVKQTRGMVLVDSEMQLITAAFHSNSGGETVSSESVWSGPLPYLTPRRDEFSVYGEHAVWRRHIAREKWLAYLKRYYDLPVEDKLIRKMALNYEQLNREIFFLDPIFDIPLKQVRKDWDFKSTFFNIEPLGSDSLLFKGRGFGHGAGLSQEGAMRMANLGFTYENILHFYYNDVHIIDLKALDFFRMD